MSSPFQPSVSSILKEIYMKRSQNRELDALCKSLENCHGTLYDAVSQQLSSLQGISDMKLFCETFYGISLSPRPTGIGAHSKDIRICSNGNEDCQIPSNVLSDNYENISPIRSPRTEIDAPPPSSPLISPSDNLAEFSPLNISNFDVDFDILKYLESEDTSPPLPNKGKRLFEDNDDGASPRKRLRPSIVVRCEPPHLGDFHFVESPVIQVESSPVPEMDIHFEIDQNDDRYVSSQLESALHDFNAVYQTKKGRSLIRTDCEEPQLSSRDKKVLNSLAKTDFLDDERAKYLEIAQANAKAIEAFGNLSFRVQRACTHAINLFTKRL